MASKTTRTTADIDQSRSYSETVNKETDPKYLRPALVATPPRRARDPNFSNSQLGVRRNFPRDGGPYDPEFWGGDLYFIVSVLNKPSFFFFFFGWLVDGWMFG